MRAPVIALDGPGSSGKSSVGAAVAAALGLRFLDTGLLYRSLTWLALDRGIDPADGRSVAPLAAEIDLGVDERGRLTHVLVGGRDVAASIHTPRVDRSVSTVARQPEVRAALLGRQRAIAAAGGIVVAGRDIGSAVLPDADVKVWLDASAEERAGRRAAERGIDPASPAGVADPRGPASPGCRGRVAGLLPGARGRRRHPRPHGRQLVRGDRRRCAGRRAGTDRGRAGSADADRTGSADTDRAGGSAVSDGSSRRRSAQEESAFALPADRLPWFVRASDLFGRTLLRCFDPGHGRGPRARADERAAHPRQQPHQQRRPAARRLLAHAGPRASGPLDGEGRGARLADRGLVHAPQRGLRDPPRRRRHGGVPPRQARARRGAGPGRLPGGHSQPDGGAAGGRRTG